MAMKKPQNALNDLWMLSTRVAIINYTLTATFLLYFLSFDLTVTENVKEGIVMIILALTFVSAYSCGQVQTKFKTCESIFREVEMKADPNVDSCSSLKSELEEMHTFQSLKMSSRFLEKSYVRRFSFPIQSQSKFCYHRNGPIFSKNGFASESLLESDPNVSESSNSDGKCCKDSNDIPVILHNCVTDLHDILERVKILNEVYINIDGGVECTNQESSTTFQNVNSDGGFIENEEYHKSKLQSVSDTQKVTDSAENACSFQPDPYQDFGISEKPIQKRKTKDKQKRETKDKQKRGTKEKSSSRLFSESVGVNPSLSKNIRPCNLNFSGDNIKEPFSKSCNSDTKEAENLLVNIPSQYSEFCCAVNALPEGNMGKKKTALEFFKTSVTRIVNSKASLKNPLRRIPMKQHMLSIPARYYLQANTKERNVAITSKMKSTVSKHSLRIFEMSTTSKNLPIIRRNAPLVPRNALIISKNELMISRNASMISRNERIVSSNEPVSENLPPVPVKGLISVDEILILMKNNFITAVNKQLVSMHDLLISKFELLDILNFIDIFYYLADLYDLYPDCNIHDDSEQDEYSVEDLILLIKKKIKKTDKKY